MPDAALHRPAHYSALTAAVRLILVWWASAAVTVAQGQVLTQPVDRLADLQTLQTASYIVVTTAGEQLRGHLEVSNGSVQVSAANVPEVRISEIRQIIPRSRGRATIVGIVAGAALSLPLSVSRRGDMIVPGALAGAFVARALVRPHEVVVFKRREPRSSDSSAGRVGEVGR